LPGPEADAEVVLTWTAADLAIRVTDTGSTTRSRPAGEGGRGLLGMRERVQLAGGRLRAGPRPGGGFAVEAELPTADVRTPS
jgi:signal transduction histidine kinase